LGPRGRVSLDVPVPARPARPPLEGPPRAAPDAACLDRARRRANLRRAEAAERRGGGAAGHVARRLLPVWLPIGRAGDDRARGDRAGGAGTGAPLSPAPCRVHVVRARGGSAGG